MQKKQKKTKPFFLQSSLPQLGGFVSGASLLKEISLVFLLEFVLPLQKIQKISFLSSLNLGMTKHYLPLEVSIIN